jgi:hypothetical protein
MEDENKVLGIVTSSDFLGYLEGKLNLDDVNARILQRLRIRVNISPGGMFLSVYDAILL